MNEGTPSKQKKRQKTKNEEIRTNEFINCSCVILVLEKWTLNKSENLHDECCLCINLFTKQLVNENIQASNKQKFRPEIYSMPM